MYFGTENDPCLQAVSLQVTYMVLLRSSPLSASPACVGQSCGKPALSSSILFQCTPSAAGVARTVQTRQLRITMTSISVKEF